MSPFAGKNSKAWDATVARINKKSNEELGEYIGKMIGYGLADSSVTLNIVRKNLGRDPNSVLQKIANNKVARIYEGEDFIFKAMHFEKTMRLKEWLLKEPEILCLIITCYLNLLRLQGICLLLILLDLQQRWLEYLKI